MLKHQLLHLSVDAFTPAAINEITNFNQVLRRGVITTGEKGVFCKKIRNTIVTFVEIGLYLNTEKKLTFTNL